MLVASKAAAPCSNRPRRRGGENKTQFPLEGTSIELRYVNPKDGKLARWRDAKALQLDPDYAPIYNSHVSLLHPPANPSPNQSKAWAQRLKAFGLGRLAAACLQAGRALTPLAAQALYITQPLASPWLSKQALGDLAQLLEEPEQTAAFIQWLQDESE